MIRRVIRSRVALLTVAVVAAVAAAVGVVEMSAGRQTASRIALDQAQTVDAFCARDPAGALESGADCGKAARIVADGLPGDDGEDGEDGADGDDGRGVVRTAITDDGRLLVTFTDGITDDIGQVGGPRGEDGRGIAGTELAAGRLLVTFTDGRSVDLGRVVGAAGADGADGDRGPRGPEGRGISTIDATSGRLVITYTDGKTEDIGPLPRGPQGPEGPEGPPGPQCPAGFEVVIGGPVTAEGGTTYQRSAFCVDPTSTIGEGP